jgi:hypothetical protein
MCSLWRMAETKIHPQVAPYRPSQAFPILHGTYQTKTDIADRFPRSPSAPRSCGRARPAAPAPTSQRAGEAAAPPSPAMKSRLRIGHAPRSDLRTAYRGLRRKETDCIWSGANFPRPFCVHESGNGPEPPVGTPHPSASGAGVTSDLPITWSPPTPVTQSRHSARKRVASIRATTQARGLIRSFRRRGAQRSPVGGRGVNVYGTGIQVIKTSCSPATIVRCPGPCVSVTKSTFPGANVRRSPSPASTCRMPVRTITKRLLGAGCKSPDKP